MDPEHDLLSHRPGGHPDRGLLAEQVGEALLEPLGERAFAVEVDVFVGRRPLGESEQGRPRIPLGRQERPDHPLAAGPDRPAVANLPHAAEP